jgi:hypothetical protein
MFETGAKDDSVMVTDGLFRLAWIRDGSGQLCVDANARFFCDADDPGQEIH